MASIGGPNIVESGLVLALDAANIKSYQSGSTTWFDISGRGNNATLYNGPTLSGGAIVMDGSNDTILAPSCNTLGGLADQALEIWVKTPGLGSGKFIGGLVCPDYGQVSYIDANGNVVYILYSTDTTPYVQLVNTYTSGVNMFDNKWHHVVCTRNEALYNIYVDGISRASGNGGGTWTGNTVWSSMNTQIGNNPNDAYYNLYGSIGLARIYRKYLTAQEVLQNYNATKGRFGL